MFLHIGKEVSILIRDIVAIINLESVAESNISQDFLKTIAEEGFVVSLTEEPHSFIVTTDKVYLSPISTSTLKKRVKQFVI